jgi:8-oxo-dGTP pyrophosphatase MutT (NUDIX family)
MLSREKSCGALVFRKNKEVEYLLLRHGAGHWDYVKGQVELNESEKDTVVRELEEETSITDARFVEGFREKKAIFTEEKAQRFTEKLTFSLLRPKKAVLSCLLSM